MKFYGLILGAVSEMVITVVALVFAGRWADGHFGTSSKYTVIGAVAGSVVGFVLLVVRLKPLMNDSDGSK